MWFAWSSPQPIHQQGWCIRCNSGIWFEIGPKEFSYRLGWHVSHIFLEHLHLSTPLLTLLIQRFITGMIHFVQFGQSARKSKLWLLNMFNCIPTMSEILLHVQIIGLWSFVETAVVRRMGIAWHWIWFHWTIANRFWCLADCLNRNGRKKMHWKSLKFNRFRQLYLQSQCVVWTLQFDEWNSTVSIEACHAPPANESLLP